MVRPANAVSQIGIPQQLPNQNKGLAKFGLAVSLLTLAGLMIEHSELCERRWCKIPNEFLTYGGLAITCMVAVILLFEPPPQQH